MPHPNQTCFCTRPKGGHSATGICGEGWHHSACMGAPPLCICLLDSCCWGWRWRSIRKQISHLSMGWECGGLGDGDKCQVGLLGEVTMHDSEDEGLWLHCKSFLWVSPLCLDWGHWSLDPDYLIDESSLGHLATSAPYGQTRGTKFARTSSCRSISSSGKWV